MKKYRSVLLSLASSLSLLTACSPTAKEESSVNDYDNSYELSDDTMLNVLNNWDPTVNIGFDENLDLVFDDVEAIYLDDNVKFEKYNFSGCTNLTSIHYGRNLSQRDGIVSEMGVNALAGVYATVYCADGNTAFDGRSMAI